MPETADSSCICISEFGATPGAGVNNAAAIQAAIDAAAQTGGRVVVPAGTWGSGTIYLKSEVELHLARGAVLAGVADPAAYPAIPPAIPSRMDVCAWKALLYAHDQENIALTGPGTFAPGGEAFRDGKENSPDRPYGLHLVGCRDVRVENVCMRNSAFWMQRYFCCDRVQIRGLNVYNHCNLNNDGLDIDCCRDVVVSDCIIDASDDAICIKSEGARDSHNVVVTNCIASSHASAIKLGTGSVGGYQRIAISNCVIRPSRLTEESFHKRGLVWGTTGINLATVDGGAMEQISLSNIHMDAVETPIFIRLGNRLSRMDELGGTIQSVAGDQAWEDAPDQVGGRARSIVLRDITAVNTGPVASSITGFPGGCVEDLRLVNIRLHASRVPDGPVAESVPEKETAYPKSLMFETPLPAAGLYVRHVRDLVLDDVRIDVPANDPRVLLWLEDTRDITLTRLNGAGASILRDQIREVECEGVRYG